MNIPAACVSGLVEDSTSPCGLIVDVHGYSMDADIEDNNTNMRALGEQHNYIVMQPSAHLGVPPFTSWSPADDKYVDAVLMEAIDKLKPDPSKVHFMGFSLGAAMTWRFICRHGRDGLFASAVALSDSIYAGATDKCLQDTKPLPVLYSQGDGYDRANSCPYRTCVVVCMTAFMRSRVAGIHDGIVPYAGAVRMRDRVIELWNLDAEGELVASVSHTHAPAITQHLQGLPPAKDAKLTC